MRQRSLTQFISAFLIGIFLFSTSVPQVIAGQKVYFYHNDPAGTPLAMTDDTGEVVWEADYMPFGEEYGLAAGIDNNKMFVGKEKDHETGLYYFDARYMEAKIGRFVSTNPVGAVDPWTGEVNQLVLMNPQRLNAYAYGLNNPYRYVDPDGENAIAIAALQAMILSSLIYATGKTVQDVYNANKDNKYNLYSDNAADGDANTNSGDDVGATPETSPTTPDPNDEQNTSQDKKQRNTSQDKKLSKSDIKNLKEKGYDVHRLKAEKHYSRYDLYKDRKGNIYVKPRGGAGAGAPSTTQHVAGIMHSPS